MLYVHYLKGFILETFGDYNTPMPFDLKAFGAGLREERTKAGFKSSTKFRQRMAELTGYELSRDTLYKIESGKREMKITLLWAWCVTLYGRLGWQDHVKKIMHYGYTSEMFTKENTNFLNRKISDYAILERESVYDDSREMLCSGIAKIATEFRGLTPESQEQVKEMLVERIAEASGKDLSNQDTVYNLHNQSTLLRLFVAAQQGFNTFEFIESIKGMGGEE
jgi:transcriptional regulator with XRE-family HTH domain